MSPIDLTGPWRLFERHDEKIPAFDEPHLAVNVPGEVRQQLVDAGRLPDPFVEDNFVAQIALEANHWWLGRTFDADLEAGAPVWLVFEGIDCRSEVFLNGRKLGSFDGMYGGPAFDVTGLIAARNELLVHVLPADTQPDLAVEFWKRGKIFEEDIAPARRRPFGITPRSLPCGRGCRSRCHGRPRGEHARGGRWRGNWRSPSTKLKKQGASHPSDRLSMGGNLTR